MRLCAGLTRRSSSHCVEGRSEPRRSDGSGAGGATLGLKTFFEGEGTP